MTPLLKRFFAKNTRLVDQALHRFLPKESARPSIIHKAMRYSVFAGGKRLRPLLVIAGAEACGGQASRTLPTAAALEFIHTYSLIHDDLPSMDNDDLRRGQPTNHKVFGEDIAILAGDALLTHAFALLHDNMTFGHIRPERMIRVLSIVAKGAGTKGMVGGQVADIKADKGQWKKCRDKQFKSPPVFLHYIHSKKTAALIRASLEAGAALAGASTLQFAALGRYGEKIGLAFQVADDILDEIGDKKKLGKKGSDRLNDKLTYPALYGIEKSQRTAKELVKDAHRCLKPIGQKAQVLHDLADYIVARDH